MAEAFTKLVNGKRVPLTAEEKAAIEAEWAANEARPKDDPFDATVAGNPLVASVIEVIAEKVGITVDDIKSSVKAKWLSKVT